MAKEKEAKPEPLRWVIYTGTKTAYYHDRSYFPGEVFQIPHEIPVRDRHGEPTFDEHGTPLMRPLVLSERSKLRIATAEEIEAARNSPRAKLRNGVNAPPSRGSFAKSTRVPGTEPRLA